MHCTFQVSGDSALLPCHPIWYNPGRIIGKVSLLPQPRRHADKLSARSEPPPLPSICATHTGRIPINTYKHAHTPTSPIHTNNSKFHTKDTQSQQQSHLLITNCGPWPEHHSFLPVPEPGPSPQREPPFRNLPNAQPPRSAK